MADTGELDGQALRRLPSQKRARERVERILQAAKALIARDGSDAMKMSELAERAEVSIGSLYQYFPDKSAVIRMLAEQYNAVGRDCISQSLAGVRDLAGLRQAFDELIDIYYAQFLEEPVMCDIWSGTQADKALQDIDLADARVNGAVLAEALIRARPDADPAQSRTAAFLAIHLGEATMRLAIAVDRAEGAALVEAYKAMMARSLFSD